MHVLNGRFETSSLACCLRPPGHHCCSKKGMAMQRAMLPGGKAFKPLFLVMALSLTAVSCGGKHHESGPDAGAASAVVDAAIGAANAVANCVERCASEASKCRVGCHGFTCTVSCNGNFDACKDSCAR